MQSRREMLSRSMAVAGLMASAGLLPGLVSAQETVPYDKAAFDAKAIGEVFKALGAAVPQESRDITVQGPDIAENGAVVPVGASTSLAGVKRLAILVEKNPSVLTCLFEIGDAVEANVATRVKMGQSSNVYAVAMMKDGRTLFAQKEVKVTLGGCGG